MINLNINFGGFYCSIHEQLIDSMLDSYYQDDDGNTLDYYFLDIPYGDIFQKYSKNYLLFLKEYLYENYNLQFKPVYKQLTSPKEYNFSTDKINIDLNNLDCNKIIKHFKKDNDFLEYLKKATKSVSGYWSFYDYDNAINNKDNILIVYIFDYICQLDDIKKEWLQYYDFNNFYEMLYRMDLPQFESALT
jgi:hypothetical protein